MGLKDKKASRVFGILEASVVVGLLSGLFPTFVVNKLFVSGKKDIGGLNELKLGLTKLARSTRPAPVPFRQWLPAAP